MSFSKASPTRKASLAAVVAAVFMVLSAGQASAHNGAGVFAGYEIPPATVTHTNPNTRCAKFHASASDPLIHQLDMDGTFHDVLGTGTATFTRETDYFLNPEGSHGDGSCTSPTALAGAMTITFGNNYSCTDSSATYERRATSAYTLTFSGTCDDTTTTGTVETIATNVTFTGEQLLCPPEDCSQDPNAASEMSGTYVQTH